MKYKSLSDYLKETFGTKVYKISLQSGCSCPNRDGSIGYGGCSFCSEGGSGDFAAPLLPIDEQISLAKARVDQKFSSKIAPEDRRYIAYFQSYTNTYGDPEKLYQLYHQTLQHPEIVGLSIGTRPDCLPPDILDMLSRLERGTVLCPGPYPQSVGRGTVPRPNSKPIWVELGLQTIHEKTAAAIHRGYSLDVFTKAYHELRARGITVIVHVILGLPGESREDILETIRFLSSLTPTLEGIKLQLLHVLKGTALAAEYEANPFRIFTLEEYCDLVVDCLKLLPEETVVHRITGDGPKNLLIAPKWSGNKKVVLNTLQKAIREA